MTSKTLCHVCDAEAEYMDKTRNKSYFLCEKCARTNNSLKKDKGLK